jgi:hypothetical protein
VASYHDLVETTLQGKEQALFDLFMQKREGRLVIICDDAAMLTIALKVMKSILPNASVDTGFTVLKYMYLPYYYLHDSGLVSYVGPTDFQLLYTNLLVQETEVKRLWAKTTSWKLTQRQREKVQQTAGVEFQTSTYLANPNWRQAATYKHKVVTFAKKSLLAMLVNDLRQKILDGFVDIEKIDPMVNPLDRNVVQQVLNNETLKFLVDPSFTPNNWKYVFTTYDISTLHTLFQTYAPQRAFNLNDFSLLAKENDLMFEDVLTHEMQSVCGRKLLGADNNYKNTVNVYLLDMMFDLYKNDQEALKRFSLESHTTG